ILVPQSFQLPLAAGNSRRNEELPYGLHPCMSPRKVVPPVPLELGPCFASVHGNARFRTLALGRTEGSPELLLSWWWWWWCCCFCCWWWHNRNTGGFLPFLSILLQLLLLFLNQCALLFDPSGFESWACGCRRSCSFRLLLLLL